MNLAMYDVETEHKQLSAALANLHAQQTIANQAHAALDLFGAIDQVEQALTMLLPQAESEDTGFQVRVLGLRTLTFVAYDAIQRVHKNARHVLDQKGILSHMSQLLDTAFSEGEILSCPAPNCGQGLYKVTARCMTADLVMDAGQLLVPLNRLIPPRGAWQGFSCVFCGSRLLQNGQLHTFQHGWK